MNRRDLRRLERLKTSLRADCVVARNRTLAWTLRTFGAALEAHKEVVVEGYEKADFASDCDLMARYRAPLDPERCMREQYGLSRGGSTGNSNAEALIYLWRTMRIRSEMANSKLRIVLAYMRAVAFAL